MGSGIAVMRRACGGHAAGMRRRAAAGTSAACAHTQERGMGIGEQSGSECGREGGRKKKGGREREGGIQLSGLVVGEK
jgi:hypothetical protein